jgi:hypothetical protein
LTVRLTANFGKASSCPGLTGVCRPLENLQLTESFTQCMACNTRLCPAPYRIPALPGSRRVRRMMAGLSGRAYAYNEGLWAVYFY